MKLVITAFILLTITSSCRDRKKTFSIPEGHVGMFGYGSLMSKKFIETGLLDKNYSGPFLPAHLKGYKRSWTFAWPSTMPAASVDGNYYRDYVLVEGDSIYPEYMMFLNIKEDPASIINGVIYIVPEADLPTYDAWELGYERFEVTDRVTDYQVEGGRVFAYKALPGFTLDTDSDYKRNVIELSYSRIIDDAFDYWGKEFEEEYKQSTLPVDPAIILETKKIPWVDPPLDTLEKLKASFKYGSAK